eukprot:TRINITY_DN40471_c0_g1_i1.p1 TRINITY_DN40471_c0_g1~~TRINITY_DN40471_c0_g1_i1.p1  ORF type:complete len:218 (+),score=60.63 TRINITY_DN40471_c0_g1_i1:58-711(+)
MAMGPRHYYSTDPPVVMWVVLQAGLLVVIAYVVLSLAVGLCTLSEWAEENASAAKRALRWAVVGSCGVMAVIAVTGSAPLAPCAASIAACASYGVLLRGYPFVEPLSWSALFAACMFLADNAAWFLHFTDDRTPFVSVPDVLAFYGLLVWPVPCGLFLSLCVPDQALPGCGSLSQGGSAHLGEGGERKRKRNGILSLVDRLLRRNDPQPKTSVAKSY